MLQRARFFITVLSVFLPFTWAFAVDADRDFSGKWLLNADHSEMRHLSGEVYPVLLVEIQRSVVHCTGTTSSGTSVEWSYRLDGEDSKDKIGAETWSSATKWEGTALLVNTLVTGPQDYTMMDRWVLSRNRNQLNITRQVLRGQQQSEGYLIYRREGSVGAPLSSAGAAVAEPGTPTLARRPEAPEPPPPTEYTIPKGTHILLSLTNPVSTKDSRDGDRVYFRTATPVALNDRIVIPRGSYVQASVTKSKAAGRVAHQGELYISFDSLTLPNGITRDFHARLTSADTVNGKVDPDEGKISGTGKGTSSGTIARDGGIGAAGGVVLGGIAGHPIAGAGIGAAAGLAAVLLSKNKDVILPRGTSVEMVLDRDLYYSAAELHP